MRHQYAASAIGKDLFYRWDRSADPVIIGYVKAFIKGNVKVNPDEGAFAFEIDVIDRFHICCSIKRNKMSCWHF
jgi:hypothetical protein